MIISMAYILQPYFSCTAGSGMYMMGYNRIVINAVSLFKDIGVFAVIDLYDTFKNIDKFFAFVCGKDKIYAR